MVHIYRLVLVCLTTALAAGYAETSTYTFNTPVADQWQYPFNFPPTGNKIDRFIFAAGQPSPFDFRDATALVRWNTAAAIDAGKPAAAYHIASCSMTIWCRGNGLPATWATSGEVDGVPQRVELFGVGYGPTYTEASWHENAAIKAGGVPGPPATRDPYPLDLIALTNVADATAGVTPWAEGIVSAASSTADVYTITFLLDVTTPAIASYLQQGLAAGRLTFMVATTVIAPSTNPALNDLPRVVFKEGTGLYPGSAAPRLELGLQAPPAPSAHVELWGNYE